MAIEITIEEMQERIAKLEAENKKLKDNQRRNEYPTIPKEIEENYSWIKKVIQSDRVDIALSKIIRSICFPKITLNKKIHILDERTGQYKRETQKVEGTIVVPRMSDEQYQEYTEIMKSVLNVLSEYRKI